MTTLASWQAELRDVLDGIERELAQPELTLRVLDDIKRVLDNVRSVVLAAATSLDTLDYESQLSAINVRRAAGVCSTLVEAVESGSITATTLGIVELDQVLKKLDMVLRESR